MRGPPVQLWSPAFSNLMLNQIWFRVVLILTLGVCAYSFMLGASFRKLDDQASIVSNPLIKDPKYIKDIFSQGYFKDRSYYRPAVLLSFMGEYHSFGLKPFFFNLDNLLLHLINSLLVWVLVFLLTKNLAIGFWAGLLFVIHPIHVEAVSNIAGRSILLGAAFSLSSFICFLLFEDKGRVRFFIASLLSFSLGLLCKESTAVLPGVIFIYLFINRKSFSKVGYFVGILGIYLILRIKLGITQTLPWGDIGVHIAGFAAFLRSVITDLSLVLLPVGLHFDRSQRVFISFLEPAFLMTIAIWIGVIAVIFRFKGNITRSGWFYLAWFALEMLPVSQIVSSIGVSPGYISTADHFLYLASIPIFVILIKLVHKIWKLNQKSQLLDVRIFKLLIGVFFVFLLIMNIEQNIYASNEIAMLERSLMYEPHNARLRSSLGLIYALSGQAVKAEEHFLRAVEDSPMNVRYRISLGKSICDQGRYKECLDIYDQIQDPGPEAKLLNENRQAALRLMEQNVSILQK